MVHCIPNDFYQEHTLLTNKHRNLHKCSKWKLPNVSVIYWEFMYCQFFSHMLTSVLTSSVHPFLNVLLHYVTTYSMYVIQIKAKSSISALSSGLRIVSEKRIWGFFFWYLLLKSSTKILSWKIRRYLREENG